MTPNEMIKKLSQLEKAVIHNKSDDGHKFECPRCGTKFDSEDTVDDFNLCYICGQRWKDTE